ncbi:hypothetical protein T02_9085 [Trichinella nativa]|uniref:Uncharacterized protein n=1 Tax=Trichinella nativa TaxID=6335 RepID=A0A0V1LBQ8_9BILA|nr:hypothetical protein T02_9085 [Trichinella nativa]
MPEEDCSIIPTLPPNNAIAFWRLWKNESSSSVDQRRHHQQLVIEKRFYHRLQSALSKRDSELQTKPIHTAHILQSPDTPQTFHIQQQSSSSFLCSDKCPQNIC